MHKITLKIISFLFFTCIIFIGCNTQKNKKINVSYTEKIDIASKDLATTMIEELMKLPSMPPGMSVAVSQDNKIIFSKAFGYSNLKTKKRVTTKTQFRAGSLSRAITATALAKLVEQEILGFDDFVHEHLQNYPKKEYPFSVKQLAVGLSGMPHYSDKDKLEARDYKTVEDALNVFSHVPISHKPGHKYQYSVHGYTLLSRVMEKASNKSFLNLLNDELFKPLSMSSTGPDMLNNPTGEITELYNFHTDGINKNLATKINNPKNYSYSWAGIGLISTPSDLVKLADAYTNGFVRKDIVDTFFKIQKLNSGSNIRGGIGWDNNWDMANRKVFEQDGIGEGARSVVSSFPNQQTTISIMANAFKLWAIEVTAHTLAIPFLTKASPVEQPKGEYKLNVAQDKGGGKWLEMKGVLILDGENDRLIINSTDENEKVYKLIYLKRKNIYALIHPDGILYSEINLKNKMIYGKVMYYRGPNIHKTSEEPPYLKFRSQD